MSTVEEVIQVNRLSRGWHLLPLCIYFPIGVVLFTLRIFVSLNALIAARLLPRLSVVRSCAMRTLCFILGIVVYEENIQEKNFQAKLIVANHVSIFDQLAVDLVLPCIMPSVCDLPQLVNWCLGYKDFEANKGRNFFVHNIKKFMSEGNCTLLSHPEGAITNGSVGLLKFQSWPFSLAQTVNPVILTISRPFPFLISANVIGSHWMLDVFWLFFCPVTFFKIRYMSEMEKDENEDDDNFAKRVQQTMATEKKIKATSISFADISEFIKRRHQQRQHRPTTPRRTQQSNSEELIRMCNQVKEVVPYVPIDVIRTDLLITNNVDVTITNILEGRIHFVPETQTDSPNFMESDTLSTAPRSQPSSIFSAESSTSNVTAASEFSTAASSFGKTADERMQSFRDRKQQLLDFARKQYLDKHKLQ